MTGERMRGTGRFGFAVLTAAALFVAQPVVAQTTPVGDIDAERVAREGEVIGRQGGAGRDVQTSVAQPVFSAGRAAQVTTSIQDRLGAAGDPGGYRAYLRDRGIEYELIYSSEVVSNLKGGMRRGSSLMGLVDAELDVDFEKLAGWKGLAGHVTLYQIHGHGPSAHYVGNILTVSNIEALPSNRLNEIWLEQTLFDGKLAVAFGQLPTDSEYMVSQTAILFANGTFGWPAVLGANMRGGGPAYPLSAPGVRVKYTPNPNLSFQSGIYDGDPGGRDRLGLRPDPQRRNPTDTRFPTTDPALLLGEVSYAYNITPGSKGEPGTVTFGGWYQLGRVNSLARDGAGLSLADPTSTGTARRLSGNHGFYGLVDQTIYREPNDPNDGAAVFVRAGASPNDRNLISLYADAGIAYRGFFQGRSDDTMGIGFGIAQISRDARRLDAETMAFTGTPRPKRSAEAVVEATYQAVLGPGMALQPSLQYVIRPSGGVANPRDVDGTRIKNALVFGLRSTIRY